MKLTHSVAAVLAALPAIQGRFIEDIEVDNVVLYPDHADAGIGSSSVETYLIEVAPGKTRRVTEEQKWELRRNGQRFMDITDTPDLGSLHLGARSPKTPKFPAKCVQQKAVLPLISTLSTTEMQGDLEKLTSFLTRYYKSDYGRESSEWLTARVREVIAAAGPEAAARISAQPFKHSWPQSSLIVTIPGKTNDTIVIGAHQDSINLWLPSVLPAPGADDDGSGTVTILEVLRTLLRSDAIIAGEATNTIEFHWYSAEEGGLLGSQAIFTEYERAGREVKAMLQQDMTGFVQKTVDAGLPESVGVITDYVDKGLTDFIKTVITEYCDIPYVETRCGYACSDHASASKAGYPSAFVIESSFENSDDHIHGTEDKIKYLSFEHMREHAKMTLGLVYELGFTDFAALADDVSNGEL